MEEFLKQDMKSTKHKETDEYLCRWVYQKLMYSIKSPHTNQKKSTKDWGKISATHILVHGKGLVSRIHKDLKLISKSQPNQQEKGMEGKPQSTHKETSVANMK